MTERQFLSSILLSMALIALNACHHPDQISTASVTTQSSTEPTAQDRPAVLEPELGEELIAMAKEDQEVQIRIMNPVTPRPSDPDEAKKISKTLEAEKKQIFDRNTVRLKEIIDDYGWPTNSMVGKKAAHSAWLLTQHADHDLAFQLRILTLMKPLVTNGEASGRSYAYLYDRVQIGRKQPQRYGTQMAYLTIDGVEHISPYPSDDPSRVNELRQEVGLKTVEDYRTEMLDLLDRSKDTPQIPEDLTVADIIEANRRFKEKK